MPNPKHPNWGGRRKGAGRPPGSRNRPRLIPDMPQAEDPLQWLLLLLGVEAVPLRTRVKVAATLMPYFHETVRR